MKKKILFILLIFLFLGGVLGYKVFYKPKLYPFVFRLEDQSKETVQIYPGTWAATGGTAFDSSGRLQIRKDGKIVNLPIAEEEHTNQSGRITFMLPAGHYFVYIPNPIYDDDLPRDITIPANTSITISGDRH